MTPQLSVEEAIATLRGDPAHRELILDSYLDKDASPANRRFASSAEFRAVLDLLQELSEGRRLLEIGAGRGSASLAFARQGFDVVALEPDLSEDIGARAITSNARQGESVSVISGSGEDLPFADDSFDIVYLRQVLHHFSDLDKGSAEIGRVLNRGGIMIATREHVVDDEDQLHRFLAAHPIHRLAGGEGAFSLDAYLRCLGSGGLEVMDVLGPWDSVINAWPAVRREEELRDYPQKLLGERFGRLGSLAARSQFIRSVAWKRLRRPVPGRMYTFIARKP